MTLALRHVICSAILNTKATATFMLDPYSKLVVAYPHTSAMSLGLSQEVTYLQQSPTLATITSLSKPVHFMP
eukprot:1154310-Pelagomonas_calceolata.AAC.1